MVTVSTDPTRGANSAWFYSCSISADGRYVAWNDETGGVGETVRMTVSIPLSEVTAAPIPTATPPPRRPASTSEPMRVQPEPASMVFL